MNENITQVEKERKIIISSMATYVCISYGKVMFTWEGLRSGLDSCFGDNIYLVVNTRVGVQEEKRRTHKCSLPALAC